MIDYKEVRIGNLVMYKGKEYKIAGITKGFPVIDTFDFYFKDIEWGDLKPIPLTVKWLVKFGFEKVKSVGFFWDAKAVFVKNDYAIFYQVNKGINFDTDSQIITRLVDKSFQYKNGHGIVNEIIYVHQLQNLYFALTNKENDVLQKL